MSVRFAVVGFRHGHIHALCKHVDAHPDCERVAACEEDAETRAALAANGSIDVTHDDVDRMLDEVECDVVAIGDCYGRRGSIAIRALQRGLHVLADKPICTQLADLDEIQNLLNEKGLKFGCMLDLRDSGIFIALRQLVQDGRIGTVQAIDFGGQHPLSFGSRPMWYFAEGMHGGTINDIAIHAIDLIPWLIGSPFATVTAARTWNAFVPDYPHFRDGAQFMSTLEAEESRWMAVTAAVGHILKHA
jgi:predicted dehydrogenase